MITSTLCIFIMCLQLNHQRCCPHTHWLVILQVHHVHQRWLSEQRLLRLSKTQWWLSMEISIPIMYQHLNYQHCFSDTQWFALPRGCVHAILKRLSLHICSWFITRYGPPYLHHALASKLTVLLREHTVTYYSAQEIHATLLLHRFMITRMYTHVNEHHPLTLAHDHSLVMAPYRDIYLDHAHTSKLPTPLRSHTVTWHSASLDSSDPQDFYYTDSWFMMLYREIYLHHAEQNWRAWADSTFVISECEHNPRWVVFSIPDPVSCELWRRLWNPSNVV